MQIGTPVTAMARPWLTYNFSVDIHIRALKPDVRMRDAISCDLGPKVGIHGTRVHVLSSPEFFKFESTMSKWRRLVPAVTVENGELDGKRHFREEI